MLDTNICIYATRGRDEELLERFETFYVGDLVMSAITFAELEAGVGRDPARARERARALANLVSHIQPVPFDAPAAACFGRIQAAAADRRKGAFDRLIAAHALSLDLTLVTNKLRDFRDVPGLKIENWATQ